MEFQREETPSYVQFTFPAQKVVMRVIPKHEKDFDPSFGPDDSLNRFFSFYIAKNSKVEKNETED